MKIIIFYLSWNFLTLRHFLIDFGLQKYNLKKSHWGMLYCSIQYNNRKYMYIIIPQLLYLEWD